ncbi:MAG: thiamine-phosphate kinase [Thermodesulfobacteriota bacterium]|nr:thiamine-phosphate kinase [Thermodesulfobacteriota bacterium]
MERDLIAKIQRLSGAPIKDPSVLVSIGDDCAVVAPSPDRYLIITTDTLVESIHFDLDYFDPWHLGRKTAAVNLSDAGAMGGDPRWALLNLAVRPGLTDRFWDSFSKGLLSHLSEYGVSLVGGDTVSAPDQLSLSLTLIGEVIKGKWLSRGRAQPDDLIYSSGYLGEAAAGLELLRKHKEKRSPFKGRKGIHGISRAVLKRLVNRHLDPEPRVTLGQALAANGMVQTAIDVSDGIATDLAHICKNSKVGAEVWAREVPVSRALKRTSGILGISPLDFALTGGEDFELLWTVSEQNESEVQKIAAKILGYRPFRIGKIAQGNRVILKTSQGSKDITYQGYEHYT